LIGKTKSNMKHIRVLATSKTFHDILYNYIRETH
jgi:hypothetical protein